MSQLRHKLVAVCLMAFWLWATQHCGLEAAGLFAAHDEASEATGCCASSNGCASDGCATVEEGDYRPDTSAMAIPAPLQILSAFLVGSDVMPPRELRDGPLLRDAFEQPLDWVRTWQFVQRAALPPRAPSLG